VSQVPCRVLVSRTTSESGRASPRATEPTATSARTSSLGSAHRRRRCPDYCRTGLCIRIGAFKHVEPVRPEHRRGNTTQLARPEPISLVQPVHLGLASAPLPDVCRSAARGAPAPHKSALSARAARRLQRLVRPPSSPLPAHHPCIRPRHRFSPSQSHRVDRSPRRRLRRSPLDSLARSPRPPTRVDSSESCIP
jgi:hypothetical protein